jgi:hypothetical protein
MDTITNKQASAAIDLIRIAYGLVAAAGSDGKPSGHLYAEMMNAFDGLEGYESMVALMARTQLLSRRGDLLIAARL